MSQDVARAHVERDRAKNRRADQKHRRVVVPILRQQVAQARAAQRQRTRQPLGVSRTGRRMPLPPLADLASSLEGCIVPGQPLPADIRERYLPPEDGQIHMDSLAPGSEHVMTVQFPPSSHADADAFERILRALYSASDMPYTYIRSGDAFTIQKD